MKQVSNATICGDLDRRSDNASWMTSYADLVTLLLCFFILFFNADQWMHKGLQSSEHDSLLAVIGIQTSRSKVNQRPLADDSSTPVSDQTTANMGIEQNIHPDADKYVASFHTSPFTSEFVSQIIKLDNAVFESGEKHLLIQFPGVVFFDQGSYQLTNIGRQTVSRMATLLQGHTESVRVTIEGYADPTPLRYDPRRRFRSNMELSALRSASVFEFLVASGIPGSILAISGFGDHHPLSASMQDSDNASSIAQERRITFRVESNR